MFVKSSNENKCNSHLIGFLLELHRELTDNMNSIKENEIDPLPLICPLYQPWFNQIYKCITKNYVGTNIFLLILFTWIFLSCDTNHAILHYFLYEIDFLYPSASDYDHSFDTIMLTNWGSTVFLKILLWNTVCNSEYFML